MTHAPSTIERGTGWRLAAFAGLSALAAWRYAGVQTQPPTVRVVGVAGVAIAAALALTLLRARESAPRRLRVYAAAARTIVLVMLLAVALVAAGVPVHLLRPAGWHRLGLDLHGGLGTVGTTLWPYAGKNSWARLDILLVLAVIPLGAAALEFWPAARGGPAAAVRHGIRQVGALALLVTVYVTGVLDSRGGSATAEGGLLLVLVVAWLWLPGLRARRAAAALAWLAAAGAVAALVASQIGGWQAWLDYRAWDVLGSQSPGIAFSWDQSYGPITWSRSQRTMFTVGAARPQLWKTTTLDRFDGLRFVRSGSDAASNEDLPLPLNDSWYKFATFTIKGLSSESLPSEQGTTVGVNYGGPIHHDQDGTARTADPLRSGDTYTVLSYVPDPTPAELRAAPATFPAAYKRYTAFDLPAPNQSGLRLVATDPTRPGQFLTGRTVGAPAPGASPAATRGVVTRILASPYGPIYLLARGLASHARTPYDVALAIESYLKANYVYGEQPPARRYPLESFLFLDRFGYCQQFSGAMALMLRMDGIPARVAAGFLPGSYDSATRKFVVRAVDAHSWVEAFFSGIGWVPFDPTPPRSVGTVPRFPGYVSGRTVFPYAALAATVGGLPQSARERIPTARHPATMAPRSDGRLPLLAAALAGLLALLALVARWLAGRARLRRSLDKDGELASAELERALRRLGYAIPATVTLRQIEQLVEVHGGPDAARYVRRLRERRYAPGAVAAATLRDRRRLRLRITAHLGLDARLRGLWALPPGTVAWRIGASSGSDQPGGP